MAFFIFIKKYDFVAKVAVSREHGFGYDDGDAVGILSEETLQVGLKGLRETEVNTKIGEGESVQGRLPGQHLRLPVLQVGQGLLQGDGRGDQVGRLPGQPRGHLVTGRLLKTFQSNASCCYSDGEGVVGGKLDLEGEEVHGAVHHAAHQLATPHHCQHAGHHPRRDLQSDAFTFELWSMVKRTVHSFDAAINCLVELDHCIRKSLGSLFPPWATGPVGHWPT